MPSKIIKKLSSNIWFLLFGTFNRKQTIVNNLKKINSITAANIFCNQSSPKVFINSIPKSGTHLILQQLERFPDLKNSGYFFSYIHHGTALVTLNNKKNIIRKIAPGYFFAGHIPYSNSDYEVINSNKIKNILLIRDPRDLLVSQLFHCLNRPTNRLHEYISSLENNELRLLALIDGVSKKQLPEDTIPQEPFFQYYKSFTDWSTQPDTLLIKYEDLVGNRGGGCDKKQQAAINMISDFVGITPKQTVSTKIEDSNTFRKGVIGDWKNHFTPKVTDTFNQKFSALLKELEYE